jgi:hypothetical protein
METDPWGLRSGATLPLEQVRPRTSTRPRPGPRPRPRLRLIFCLHLMSNSCKRNIAYLLHSDTSIDLTLHINRLIYIQSGRLPFCSLEAGFCPIGTETLDPIIRTFEGGTSYSTLNPFLKV